MRPRAWLYQFSFMERLWFNWRYYRLKGRRFMLIRAWREC